MSDPFYVPPASDPESTRPLHTDADDAHDPYHDAAILDSYFQASAPPMPSELPVIVSADENAAPPARRLVLRSIVLYASWAPLCIMPTDPTRINLQVSAAGSAGKVYISDDPTVMTSANRTAGYGVFMLTPGGAPLSLEHFDGPLWAYSDTDGNIINAVGIVEPQTK